MSRTIKIVTKKEPIVNLIPPIILEIINDNIKKYVKDNDIVDYTVDFGFVTQKVTINIKTEEIEVADKSVFMSYQGKLIEAILLDHYQLTEIRKNIYSKTRKREIIKFRQVIQFFLWYYSTMSLAAIGLCTGEVDHASVGHSKKTIYMKAEKNMIFRKELFLLDLRICKQLGINSKIFNSNAELTPTYRRDYIE
jgi:chromosomal replication initiation ATPase DnaA